MLKLFRAGAVICILVFCSLSVSWAGAAEWHANGPLTTTSTDAGVSRLAVHRHDGTSSLAFSCGTASLAFTFNSATSTALPWTNAATVTPTLTGCGLPGGAGFLIACGSAEFRTVSYLGGTTFGTAGGGITTGAVTNIDCRVRIGTTDCVTITGSVPVHYTNAGVVGGAIAGNGRLTLTAVGQALTANQLSSCALFPSGTVTWGSPGPTATAINDLTFTFDGPNAPYIYRTP